MSVKPSGTPVVPTPATVAKPSSVSTAGPAGPSVPKAGVGTGSAFVQHDVGHDSVEGRMVPSPLWTAKPALDQTPPRRVEVLTRLLGDLLPGSNVAKLSESVWDIERFGGIQPGLFRMLGHGYPAQKDRVVQAAAELGFSLGEDFDGTLQFQGMLGFIQSFDAFLKLDLNSQFDWSTLFNPQNWQDASSSLNLDLQSKAISGYAETLEASAAQVEDFAAAMVGFPRPEDLMDFLSRYPDLEGLKTEASEKDPLFFVQLSMDILDHLSAAYGKFPEELARDMRAYAAGQRTFRSYREVEFVSNPSPGAARDRIPKDWAQVPAQWDPHKFAGEMQSIQDRGPFFEDHVGILKLDALARRKLEGVDEPLQSFAAIVVERGIDVVESRANRESWPETSVTFGRLSGNRLWAMHAIASINGFRVTLIKDGVLQIALDATNLTPEQVAARWKDLAKKF